MVYGITFIYQLFNLSWSKFVTLWQSEKLSPSYMETYGSKYRTPKTEKKGILFVFRAIRVPFKICSFSIMTNFIIFTVSKINRKYSLLMLNIFYFNCCTAKLPKGKQKT